MPRSHISAQNIYQNSGKKKTLMVDATYLKAHRTASSLGVKKGGVDA